MLNIVNNLICTFNIRLHSTIKQLSNQYMNMIHLISQHLHQLIINFHQQPHLAYLESMDQNQLIYNWYIQICTNINHFQHTSYKNCMSNNNQFYYNTLSMGLCIEHICLILKSNPISMMQCIFHFKVTIMNQCSYSNNFNPNSCMWHKNCYIMNRNIFQNRVYIHFHKPYSLKNSLSIINNCQGNQNLIELKLLVTK